MKDFPFKKIRISDVETGELKGWMVVNLDALEGFGPFQTSDETDVEFNTLIEKWMDLTDPDEYFDD